MTGAIPSRDVRAPAERHGKMREIAADALPFVERLPRGLGGTSCHIVIDRSVADADLHEAQLGNEVGSVGLALRRHAS
jgi:hypothetical protein